ncbi:hypothetical protein L8T26_05170 [Lactococcus petauri]|uniref:hypothetical protein n=1 Tax=Lactococcus petauri TaxID=1940789 RepID=UPI001EE14BB4|nr:hypothetical protein [Lactococcus petauri]MCG3096727.1 hypothetical protein [Lactococcus petauri]
MLEFNNQKRGSGKTTEVIKAMKQDESSLCIVPNSQIKRFIFPKELQNRVISSWNIDLLIEDLKGRIFSKIFVDELLYSNFDIARLFYELGARHISVVVYGSE